MRDQFKERHCHLSWNTPSLSFWCWLCIIRVSPFCIRDLNVDCRILSEIQASELVVLKIKLVLCYLLFVGYFNICCKVVKTSFNSDFFLLTYGPCTHLINSTVFCLNGIFLFPRTSCTQNIIRTLFHSKLNTTPWFW